jgi:hypothetical protein
MFPHELPLFIRENPLRSAECKVYDRLRRLPAEYTVFYSRPWLGLAPDGREIDGEADFLVAHPVHGILSIEVKGGRIRRDATSDTWTSVDRNAIPHPIKNPVDQARRSKHQILEKLNAMPGWRGRRVRASHGVIFPDVLPPDEYLGADMPLEIFAFRDSMTDLPGWVARRMSGAVSHVAEAFQPLGDDGVQLLEDLVARSFELHCPLGSDLAADDRKIVVLTEQQFQVLDGLEHHRRCAIAGGAGTGKTMLAFEKAKRLANAGSETLLTCYSRPLATYLQRRAASISHLTVLPFDGIAQSLANVGGSRRPRAEYPEDALMDALERAPESALFDAIVVDEGQDFQRGWWIALEMCLRDPASGCFYVFYDDNQRVYERTEGWSGPLMSYELTKNLRNTKEICIQSLPHYVGGRLQPGGPEGRPAEYIEIPRTAPMREILAKVVERLTKREEISVDDIAVLLPSSDVSEVIAGGKIAGFQLSSADTPRHGTLVVDSIDRFKGLERAVILLAGLREIVDRPELLYVGITRARTHLIFIGGQDELELLRSVSTVSTTAVR